MSYCNFIKIIGFNLFQEQWDINRTSISKILVFISQGQTWKTFLGEGLKNINDTIVLSFLVLHFQLVKVGHLSSTPP